jgi:hypothetical protein
MNTYTIDITTLGEDVQHVIEATKCSVNYNNGVIEAVVGEGAFKVVKLPEDWQTIDATEELGEEEQAALDAARAEQEALLAAQQQVLPPVEAPVAPMAPVPPGQ